MIVFRGLAKVVAESGGFEPPVQLSPYNGLANRRLQPLGQLSGVSRVAIHHNYNQIRYALATKQTYPWITCAEKRSISSACGLDCSNTMSTPTAENSSSLSFTASGVPTNPLRSPRFDTE